MLGETWEDQYKRLQRQYALLEKAADANTDYNELLHDRLHARDHLFHFCCDAFYLREWIEKSSLAQPIRDDLPRLLNTNGTGTSAAISACADIANGSKHFGLTGRSYTTGTNTGHAQIVDHVQGVRLPAQFPFHFGANHFKIDVRGVVRDGLDLARDAVADWDAWLASHGVPLPT
jgi:hypothetical protein